MDEVTLVLIAVLPSLVVFLTTYYMMKHFHQKEEAEKIMELRKSSQAKTLPLRLKAYERIILLLERISPNSLVMRQHKPGISAKMFQQDLINAIRSEFEHNMSQQTYVSNRAWKMVRDSKEETIKIINLAGQKVEADASGTQLSQVIFEIMAQLDEAPTEIAARAVKDEIRKIF